MRAHNTYRSARRNEWRGMTKWLGDAGRIPWLAFNRRDHTDKFDVGSETATFWIVNKDRSRYMPHIGKKERGRYAVN